jgi:hypothetical protein
MRKYKLIKEYPSSPKLGTIVNDVKTTFGISFYENCQGFIGNYPEYWEEIIEKDYEILSFKCNDFRSTFVWNITDDKKYHSGVINDKNWSLDEMLDSKNEMYIYSIKRLSDGEIFTIGDKLEYNMIIKKFKIQNFGFGDKMTAEDEEPRRFLNELKKIKKPLFTTEDGVDIFEDEQHFTVDYDFNCIKTKRITKPLDNDIKFSTKEKAEEYILMNKPCLSLKEIKETTTIKGLSLKKLEILVKQKIK